MSSTGVLEILPHARVVFARQNTRALVLPLAIIQTTEKLMLFQCAL